MKNKLSLRAMESLLKKAGTNRCSESAKKQLRNLIEERAELISTKASTFSQHANRKTIKKQDILLARKN